MRRFVQCLLVGLVVCCVFPATAAGLNVAVVADAAVERAALRDVDEAVEAVRTFYSTIPGAAVSREVTLKVVFGEDAYQRALVEQFGVDDLEARRRARLTGGWTKDALIVTNLAAYKDKEHRIYHVAHELTHQMQFALAGDANVNSLQWLAEGMAEVAAAKVFEHAGLGQTIHFQRNWRLALARQPRRPALAELADESGWYQALDRYGAATCYQLAALAALRLAEQRGMRALLAFYRKLGDGSDVASAFKTCFGQELAAYQQDFEMELEEELRNVVPAA